MDRSTPLNDRAEPPDRGSRVAMDTLVSMKAFVRVVELGSFAAAARAMQLSPAMVTNHVAYLERRVGTRLLNRTTRRVAATDAGRAYYERCVDALAAIDEAEAIASNESVEPRGALRLTAPVEFGNMHLAPRVAEFMRRHPQVEVHLDLSNRVFNLIDEGIDAALRIARTFDPGVVARQLARSRLMIVASPAYFGDRPRPSHPAELAKADTLAFGVPRPWTAIGFERGAQHAKARIAPRLQTSSSETLRQLACEGLGCVMLPTFVAGADVAAGRLIDLFPDWRIGELAISVVYQNRKLQPARVRAFVDFMVEGYGPDPTRDPWEPRAGG